jgi:hypothetical protein
MQFSARSVIFLVLKILALTIVLLLIAGLGSRFIPAQAPELINDAVIAAPETTQPSGSFLVLILGVLFAQTLALAYPILRSRWSGWQLTLSMLLVFFGTVTFMPQMESFIYLGDKMSSEMLRGIVAMGAFNAVVYTPIAVWVLGGWRRSNVPENSTLVWRHSARGWARRICATAGIFLALYYLFGYYVAWKNPVLREYYGGTDPGSFFAQMKSVLNDTPWMIPVQYLRGSLWVLIALPVIRMMKGAWWESGLALAVLFSVPSLYLLLPNPLMPESVAWSHMIETLPYQFLFGWLVAWIFQLRGHPSN